MSRTESFPKPPEGRARLVLVTGLSGSGKSSVAKSFEDLGYYTVDNLPLPLLQQFLDRPLELVPDHRHLAVVTDVRATGFAREFPGLVAGIDRQKVQPTLIFLEAADEVLVRRFSETRRPHPLAGDRPVIDGIRQEREELAEVRALADMVIDTSEWSIHQVRSHVYREFAEDPTGGLVVSLVSFGFKYGIPYGTDLLFDVRYLPNPHFVPGLREHTGLEAPVQEFLLAEPDFIELVERLRDLLLYLLPRYQRENRSYLSVAIGCTGGKHRSAAVSVRLAAELEQAGWAVRVLHRDLGR